MEFCLQVTLLIILWFFLMSLKSLFIIVFFVHTIHIPNFEAAHIPFPDKSHFPYCSILSLCNLNNYSHIRVECYSVFTFPLPNKSAYYLRILSHPTFQHIGKNEARFFSCQNIIAWMTSNTSHDRVLFTSKFL